jgi:hypothetical protein
VLKRILEAIQKDLPRIKRARHKSKIVERILRKVAEQEYLRERRGERKENNMGVKIKSIIIHCSDSAWGSAKVIKVWHTYPKDLADGSVMYAGKRYKDRELLPARVRTGHGYGWRDNGYHWVISNGQLTSKIYEMKADGLLEAGRKFDNDDSLEWYEKGAHAGREVNKYSIGICLIGRRTFTFRQFETLLFLLRTYRAQIPDVEIFGHYELKTIKTCPNIDMDRLREALKILSAQDAVESYLSQYLSS